VIEDLGRIVTATLQRHSPATSAGHPGAGAWLTGPGSFVPEELCAARTVIAADDRVGWARLAGIGSLVQNERRGTSTVVRVDGCCSGARSTGEGACRGGTLVTDTCPAVGGYMVARLAGGAGLESAIPHLTRGAGLDGASYINALDVLV